MSVCLCVSVSLCACLRLCVPKAADRDRPPPRSVEELHAYLDMSREQAVVEGCLFDDSFQGYDFDRPKFPVRTPLAQALAPLRVGKKWNLFYDFGDSHMWHITLEKGVKMPTLPESTFNGSPVRARVAAIGQGRPPPQYTTMIVDFF
jgi:hypothetical protein